MPAAIAVRLRHAAWEQPVAPLDEPPGALLVGDLPLCRWQERAAAAAGLAVVDVEAGLPLPTGARLAFTADAVFSASAAARLLAARDPFVQAAIAPGTPLSRAVARMRGPDALRVPLWAGALQGRLAAVDARPAAALDTATPQVIADEQGARAERVPPYGPAPHVVEVPAVQRLCGEVTHWLEALELSLAALATRRLELGLGEGKDRLGAKVDVHPTAYVSGSILEDGVRLEPHASVIDSFVGKGVLVADHSVIVGSVIGEGCRTLVDTSLRRVVAQPGSTLSNLGLSDVIVGRDVFLTTAVSFYGPAPGHDVMVEGRDTGRALLGGAIGARAVLGARALLAAGLALPPGIIVVSKPDEAAAKLDDAGLARAHMQLGDRARDF
ncbi:MAG: hypothetical protein HYS27_21045 [Deltaproteobacteria bacterium]|nr:hypothetical protein [Deltaproteobacteria bacterium]